MFSKLSAMGASRSLSVLLLAGASLGSASPSAAQTAQIMNVNMSIEDVGAPERIDHSGRLRMFSQEIAATSCYVAAKIDSEVSQGLLVHAIAQFDKFLTALRDGDESVGVIGPEKRAKTLRKMDALSALWVPYKAAAEAVAAGQVTDGSIAFIAENNLGLMALAADLAADINAQYANPVELTQANAMLLDIAGRQRMLTQKMSKEACGVETNNPAFGSHDDLAKTMGMFDVSLNALTNGMPEAGIMPPPNAQIETALVAANAKWMPIKANLQKVADEGVETSHEVRDAVLEGLEELREEMRLITEQYRDAAK